MLATRAEAEDRVRRVLTQSGADACVVSLDGHVDRNLRFVSRGGASNGASGGTRVTVTSTIGRRQGTAAATGLDAAALSDVVARSEAAARSAPEYGELVPPLGPQRYEASTAYVEASANVSADALADLLEPAVRGARRRGLDVAAFSQARTSWRAFATSAGAFGFDRATGVVLSVSARNRHGTWSGWAGVDHNDLARIDAAALADVALHKALAQPEPVALEPGRHVVLLEPSAVAQMVGEVMQHFAARAAEESRSFLARKGGGTRLGERLFDERVTIGSDPADALAPGVAFGEDGLPNRPVAWIENGVVRTLMRDRYWAYKTGMDPVPEPQFYSMRGTDATPADMAREVKHGILVTRIWYVRRVNVRTLQLTGLTRDGTFLIENGVVTRPIVNFRFNESPLALLKGILAIGRPERARRAEGSGSFAVPPLLVKDFTFSSVSAAV